MVKVAVAVWRPFASEFAAAFSEPVTFTVAPAASVPEAEESESHGTFAPAVQFSAAALLLRSVNCVEVTSNGPPTSPRELKPPAGETPRSSGRS